MTMENCILACSLAFLTGMVFGNYLCGVNWELSAEAHHHSQKWGGVWYWVMRQDYKPDCLCPVCKSVMPANQSSPESYDEVNL